MKPNVVPTEPIGDLPDWVPENARNYLIHTEAGLPIRALARSADCHASTILRQIRKIETRRDDPLVDQALKRLARGIEPVRTRGGGDLPRYVRIGEEAGTELQDTPLSRDVLRVLRRLCEPGAILAVARGMERAVIARDDPTGADPATTAVDPEVAEILALNAWVATSDPEGRIVRYRVTTAGRTEMKDRLIAADRAAQERARDAAEGGDDRIRAGRRARRIARVVVSETPLLSLARRKDRDGSPFLNRAQVRAGERLREDFEMAQMADGPAEDWTVWLTADDVAEFGDPDAPGPAGAVVRLRRALSALGPGLGDAALGCCCHLEGMEETERRLGWAARSGKIVLRIALTQLSRHYEAEGPHRPRIG